MESNQPGDKEGEDEGECETIVQWLDEILPNLSNEIKIQIETYLSKHNVRNKHDLQNLDETIIVTMCDDMNLDSKSSMKLGIELSKILNQKETEGNIKPEPMPQINKIPSNNVNSNDNNNNNNVNSESMTNMTLFINEQEAIVYNNLIEKLTEIKTNIEGIGKMKNSFQNHISKTDHVFSQTQKSLHESIDFHCINVSKEYKKRIDEFHNEITEFQKKNENALQVLNGMKAKYIQLSTVHNIHNDKINVDDEINKQNKEKFIAEIRETLNNYNNTISNNLIDPLISFDQFCSTVARSFHNHIGHLFIIKDNDSAASISYEDLMKNFEMLNKENQQIKQENTDLKEENAKLKLVVQQQSSMKQLDYIKVNVKFTHTNGSYGIIENNGRKIKSKGGGCPYLMFASNIGYKEGRYYWHIRITSKGHDFPSVGVVDDYSKCVNYDYRFMQFSCYYSFGYGGNVNDNESHLMNNDEIKIELNCDDHYIVIYRNGTKVSQTSIREDVIFYPAVQICGCAGYLVESL